MLLILLGWHGSCLVFLRLYTMPRAGIVTHCPAAPLTAESGAGSMTVSTAEIIARVSEAAGQTSKYKSVSIRPGEFSCPAAKKYGNRRLLLSEAPTLPLPNCSTKSCDCKFFIYGDRRSCLTNRRTNVREVTKMASLISRGNRRKGAERRRLKVKFLR
jgi:hypothetical protein